VLVCSRHHQARPIARGRDYCDGYRVKIGLCVHRGFYSLGRKSGWSINLTTRLQIMKTCAARVLLLGGKKLPCGWGRQLAAYRTQCVEVYIHFPTHLHNLVPNSAKEQLGNLEQWSSVWSMYNPERTRRHLSGYGETSCEVCEIRKKYISQ
jgi:hypothetical protein